MKTKMPTIALQMIVKNEVEAVLDMIVNARQYFNEINITVSDKEAYDRMVKLYKDYDVNLEHRPWTDDFAAARNDNLKLCNSDYFLWLDADDQFDFATLPRLLAYAHANQFDALYLPYNYAQDADGHCVALHVRERIIRRAKGFTWRGVVHESLLVDGSFKAKRLDAPEVFHKGGDVKKSMDRNHKILAKAVEGKTLDEVDPRNVYYYGLSLFGIKQYPAAIEILKDYINVSGWDEEAYRALVKIGESYFMMDKHADAIEWTLKAVALMPELNEAYYAIARYNYALEKWTDTLEWIEVAASKPDYDGMSVQNPQIKNFAKVHAAISQYKLGNYKLAYKYLQTVPDGLADELHDGFKTQSQLEGFIQAIPELLKFVKGSDLYHILPELIKYDPRLKWLRNDVTEPTVWPNKSIVFFCGEGYEEWGAHTLDKGMGGSEEAVVYLSRELAKLGYFVTIYNHVSEEHHYDNVHYKPWRTFDTRDTFDTFVAWRSPEYAEGIKAKTKIIDLHDVLTTEHVQPRDDATYFVKSKFHRELWPDVKDDNFKIIGNGLAKQQFAKVSVEKKPNSVGYFSAYYRGLETLLRIWPAIRKQVPDATLDIYYGWESWTKIQGEDAFYDRMVKKLDDLKDQGVTEHGRVSHEELAYAMKRTEVWAYPTEFPEIHCITALKAQEAEAYPVTTDVAALAETVQSGVKIATDTINTDDYQQNKFIKEVVAALKEHKRGTPVPNTDWSDIAKEWGNHIETTKK